MQWLGGTWRQHNPPVRATGLDRVVGDGHGGLWASDGGVLHYAGGRWRVARLPTVKGKSISVGALARIPRSGSTFALGSLVWGGYPSTDGLILRYRR